MRWWGGVRRLGAARVAGLILVAASTGVGPTPVAARQTDDGARVEDERSLAYRHDPELGWFPRADHRLRFAGGSRPILVEHNRDGFRDRLPAPTKSRPRLAFLGDSFVWGYDVERAERFTDLLQERMPGIEVLNLGVSGYGTDQSYLLLRRFFDRYEPDAVVYLFDLSDLDDNAVNFNYGAYYKPYFVAPDGVLELRGVPVPRASVWSRFYRSIVDRLPRVSNPRDVTPLLVATMRSFVLEHGATFAVGLVDDHPPLRAFLEREKVVFFDLSHVDERYRFREHGAHWTPEGHRLVAGAVEAFLLHNLSASERREEEP